MKNKVISAMLLGMSATMAVPGTVVMAAEDSSESTAVEETAAEVPETETEAEGSNAEPDQNSEDNAEQDVEVAVQEMKDYATDESAKTADTPDDFGSELDSISFSQDVFGKYADSLNEYVNGPDVDMSSIYNCEMDMVNKIAELAKEESPEAIAAAKYQIALTFEAVYGEDVFMPGRDIRCAIIADDSRDEDFAMCGTISEADAVYINAGGNTAVPATLFKAEPEQPNSPDATTTPENPENPESPNPTTEPEQPNSPTESDKNDSDTSASDENKSLDEYVTGIDDIEMQLGDDIPNPKVSYDNTKVASVSLDTSKVNKDVIGVYTISYIITGLDGTTKVVDKQCTVSENPVLTELRAQMCAKADEMEKGKFTEEEFKNEWDEAVRTAKDEINTKTNEKDMQTVLDNLANTGASLLDAQQLYITKSGYIDELNKHYDSVEFITDAQENMAKAALEDATTKIKKSKTVDEAKSALDEGISQIDKIVAQDESSIDSLKKEAQSKIDEMMSDINDTTTISQNVYNALIKRLDECTTAKEIDSVTNSANSAFVHIKNALDGDIESLLALYKDMKGLAGDSDTTETIDEIIALGSPKNISDGEDKVSDICKALTSSVDEFTKYLTSRAGKQISGSTKAEAYAMYIKITNGTPDEDLSKVKEDAKSEIEKALDEIMSDESSVTEKKEEIKNDVFEKIDEASTVDDVKSILSDAKSEINSLKDEVKDNEKLKSTKTEAKATIQKIINAQSDAELKASIQNLADAAFAKIDSAKTEDEVNDIVQSFKSDAQNIIATFKENKKLAAAKADALSKLSTLETKVKSEYVTSEMNNIISTAKSNITNAKLASECSNIYAQAKTDYNNAYLASMRSVYGNKLDALLIEYKFTDDTYSQKAQEVINKQKENVNKAKNETTMEKCYNLAKDSLEKLVSAQDTAAKLAQAKTDAIAKIKAMVTNPTDTSNKIIDTYIEKINQATSEDDINKLVEECQQALKDAGTDTNNTADASKLAQLRADAISTLQKMLDTVPSDKKEDAQKVFDSYVEKINADTTEDAINKDLEEGKAALKKYGASDVTDNTPTPNSNTSTTLDGSGSGATEKGSDVATTSGVKTGDDNMSIIAMAGAAITAALAAAFISLKKFIKK